MVNSRQEFLDNGSKKSLAFSAGIAFYSHPHSSFPIKNAFIVTYLLLNLLDVTAIQAIGKPLYFDDVSPHNDFRVNPIGRYGSFAAFALGNI
jgi:hypothetical protein